MKWFLSFAISFLFLPLFSQEDAVVTHFDDYLSDAEFKSVYISPRMLDVIVTRDSEKMDPEVISLIKKLKGLRSLKREGQSGLELYKEGIKKLKAANYEELMTLKENGEQIRFYTKGATKTVEELTLIVGGPNRFLILTMVGDIDINAVAKLSKNLNVQGAGYLDKVKSR